MGRSAGNNGQASQATALAGQLGGQARQAKSKKKQTWATETDLIKQVIKVDAGYL